MFNSYKFIFNESEYKYEITIIDSEFEESINVDTFTMWWFATPNSFVGSSPAATASAIKIYSARNMNVSKNLFLLFKFIENYYGSWWSIKDQYEWCLKHVPEYKQYHEGVKKFLLFS